MTRLSFDGPVPSDDEVAAITVALLRARAADETGARASRQPAWVIAARSPELSFDDVRAIARGAARLTGVVR